MAESVLKTPPASIYPSLRALLEEVEQEPAPRRSGPGRPAKNRADTAPVILHLYKSHIRWLDEYAAMIQAARPDNARLSRVEIIRGLLLGLGQFALEHQLQIPDRPITSERDLQQVLAQSLNDVARPTAADH